MNFILRAVVFCALSTNIFFNHAVATVILPDPDCGFSGGDNCLVFDDFTVFSMSFLQNNLDGSLKPVSGDAYYIDSSPGKIKNDIVIASSPAGARDNSDIAATGIDDAFDTPNAGASELFAMMAVNEPGPAFAGDNIQQAGSELSNPNNLDIDGDGTGDGNLNGELSLWDITTTELTSFLDGDDLLFFFNLNETGANDELDSGQDMLAWLRVYLTNSLSGDVVEFTLSGNNTANPVIQSQAQTAGVDNILPGINDEWAYVHGEVCVDSTNGAVLALGSCSANGNPTNGVSVDQNLGAASAAFGLWNNDLNKALYSGDYDVMTVDLRMSHIENGYEQLFIRAGQVGERVDIPEPASLLLILFAIVGLGWSKRRLC